MRRWWQTFVNRHPLLVAAVASVAAVAVADGHPWRGCAASLLIGALGFRYYGFKRALWWLACALVAVVVFTWRDGARKQAEHVLLALPSTQARAVLTADARGVDGYWAAPARLLDGPCAGSGVWWQGRGELPVAGAVVAAMGGFTPLVGPRNPGEFDRAAWLRRQGVAATFETVRPAGKPVTGDWARLGARVRHGFREAVTLGLEEESVEARVIRAVVIGEQPPDAESLVAEFRNCGTLHVFSVSGLHVTMVAAIVWFVLSRLGVSRRRAVMALLPVVFGYAWITGNSAPAVRSAWMAAVFLGAFVFRRKPDLLNALGAVLLGAMLWDGRLLFQPGVQLSYGVVMAIAIGTSWAARSFAWMVEPELYVPERMMSRWQMWYLKARQKLAQYLSVSLSAVFGSAPLTLYHFGLITPVSLLAGFVVVPLVFVLLVVSLTAVVCGSFSTTAAMALNRCNGYVARLCVFSAKTFSAIPGGHYQILWENQPMLLVYDLEHGAGAACFSGGKSGAVLLDCGDPQSFRHVVAPSLRKLGIEPDSVVLSHPDGRHLGGGPQVWEALRIRQALAPVRLSRSPAFRAWINDAPKAGISLRQAANTSTLALPDGAILEVLHAPDALAVNTRADDRVAIYRLHWRGWKILFTSDAGLRTEQKLLKSGKNLNADVIIAGRHRSDVSLSDPFLDAVKPQAIIASNAAFPLDEQLPATAVAYWRSRHIAVADQAQTGGVTLHLGEDGSLQIKGFLNTETIVLHKH